MPVDDDLIEARECRAILWERNGSPELAAKARSGGYDIYEPIKTALIAIKRAKERSQ